MFDAIPGRCVRKETLKTPIRMAFMARRPYDPDEEIGLDMEPEEALQRIMDGAGTEEEEVEMEPEEPETEA
jgi:thymidylate kinase